MIWVKTAAGRIEMQTRQFVKERPRRNLLLTIDGVKSAEMLLAHLDGVGPADFEALHALGLIEPVVGVRNVAPRPAPVVTPIPAVAAQPAPAPRAELDYAQFTAVLTQLISSQLGLRGFMLTLAVEKASTIEALRDVGERAIEQIAQRKGAAAAAEARKALYGD